MPDINDVVREQDTSQGSSGSYITGYVLSIVFTIIPYTLVVNDVLTGWGLYLMLACFAIVQLFVQLVFFLHLGRESKPRWNLLVFLFAVLVVVILVFGSLWIMKNLNYHSMSPQATDKSIIKDEGIKRQIKP